jgi:hypothetical protein
LSDQTQGTKASHTQRQTKKFLEQSNHSLRKCHTPLYVEGMSAMTATLLTADDYIATGDTRPRCTELINGEVIVNSQHFGIKQP